jgi:hypothetical protein
MDADVLEKKHAHTAYTRIQLPNIHSIKERRRGIDLDRLQHTHVVCSEPCLEYHLGDYVVIP